MKPSVTISQLFEKFNCELADIYPKSEINQLIYLLIEHRLGWSKVHIHLEYNKIIPEMDADWLFSALADLKKGIPLQYIIGVAWFEELRLLVGPGVLIPRPETAGLCQKMVRDLSPVIFPGFKILDIGTGSGCIAIYLKKHLQECEIHGVDISVQALNTAMSNAKSTQTDIQFFHFDVLNKDQWPNLASYHTIVSNPPYVTESERVLMHRNVLDHEPTLALFVPDSDPLLFYRAICEFAILHLEPGGRLYLEINENFGLQTVKLLEYSGFIDTMLLEDIHGKHRYVTGRKTDTLPGL